MTRVPRPYPEAVTRNPTWARDELILALDLFVRRDFTAPDDRDPDVVALSSLLRSLPIHPPALRTEKFRNPNGVSKKLLNIMWYATDEKQGLPAGGRGDKQVWADLGDKPMELRRLALAIQAGAKLLAEEGVVVVDADDQGDAEGRVLLAIHRRLERAPGLVGRKIKAVIRDTGRLACEVCGFEYADVYGYHGANFAEVHHRRPLGEIGETRTRLIDLAIVCGSCHGVIHRKRPAYTVEELRAIVLAHTR